MLVREFIEEKIRAIGGLFDDVEVYYEYKEMSETHFLKVLPKSVFNVNEFKNLKASITSGFVDNDFDGLICFISDDSQILLEGPEKIFSNSSQVIDNCEFISQDGFSFKIPKVNDIYSLAA